MAGKRRCRYLPAIFWAVLAVAAMHAALGVHLGNDREIRNDADDDSGMPTSQILEPTAASAKAGGDILVYPGGGIVINPGGGPGGGGGNGLGGGPAAFPVGGPGSGILVNPGGGPGNGLGGVPFALPAGGPWLPGSVGRLVYPGTGPGGDGLVHPSGSAVVGNTATIDAIHPATPIIGTTAMTTTTEPTASPTDAPTPTPTVSRTLSPTQARAQCQDTPGWKNPTYDCAAYAARGWCADGKVAPGNDWTIGANFNNPEENCCICGKDKGAKADAQAQQGDDEDDEGSKGGGKDGKGREGGKSGKGRKGDDDDGDDEEIAGDKSLPTWAKDCPADGSSSGDCKAEHRNANNNRNIAGFCNRCKTEGGSNPLRKRCSLCCSACGGTTKA